MLNSNEENNKNTVKVKCNKCIGNCTCIRLGKLVEKDYNNIDFSYFDDLDIFKDTKNKQVSK